MTEFRCSASFKRADQLKRWEESETNHQSASPKPSVRIRFSVDCVFLAACAAGDKDEVLRLVQTGADINTPSVDGLTALHQACIDAKLDMVEFLIGLGADVNHSDNEGWTPLHATASCGFLSIAHFLLDNGANITAVNNEGELPVDIAESGPMKNFLEDEIAREGIDCVKARAEEERNLLELAKRWTIIYSEDAEHPDERTGATPLHVAAAKGYLKVMKVLLSNCSVNVDPVDFDGWTPLHAAAHWGQPDAAALLVEFGADMDIKNFVGQTCFDVSVSNMRDHLNELKSKQPNIQYKKKRRPPVLKKVELKIESKIDNNSVNKKTIESESPSSSDYSDSDSDSICDISPDYISNANISDNDKKNALNLNSHSPTLETKPPKSSSGQTTPTILFSPTEPVPDDEPPSWRLNLSRQKPNHNDFPSMEEKENTINPQSSDSDNIILRRTNSCESDKTLLQQDKQKKEIIPPAIPPNIRSSTESVNEQSNATSNNSSPVTPPTPISKLSPGNIFKNFFKSFVPPVRDEESETQRKAHAKRVRETRRSTQGVTLDEIKSAEQLVKKKNNPSPPTKSPAAPETVPSESTDTQPPLKTDTHSVNDTAPTQDNFALEDANAPSKNPLETTNADSESPESTDAAPTVTIPLRRTSSSTTNKKDDDKEIDTRGATQAAQNVIQRRRRPKRRSTGVVNVDMDEIASDRQNSDGAESGTDSTEQSGSARESVNKEENGEIDYKALWEASQVEVKRLNEVIIGNEKELTEARNAVEKYTNMVVSENEKREKRERRAMERKLSEMEEELKFQQTLQAENQRLKDENGALIRVISKLSK